MHSPKMLGVGCSSGNLSPNPPSSNFTKRQRTHIQTSSPAAQYPVLIQRRHAQPPLSAHRAGETRLRNMVVKGISLPTHCCLVWIAASMPAAQGKMVWREALESQPGCMWLSGSRCRTQGHGGALRVLFTV